MPGLYSRPMDDATARDVDAIRALITDTYAAMSSGSPGTEMAARMAEGVTRLGYRWTPAESTIWVRGAFAWAQILGYVTVMRDSLEDVVPYWTTGIFGREADGWTWLYWGGSEPQAEPRV